MNEREWRTVSFPDANNPIFFRSDGVRYLKKYFPIGCLKVIRLFCLDKIESSQPSNNCIKYKDEFEKHLSSHNWNIPVIIEKCKDKV